MAYRTVTRTVYGGRYDRRRGDQYSWQVFDEFAGGPEENNNFDLESITGTFTGRIPLGITKTLFKRAECTVDEYGPKSFDMELNAYPPFPIERFSTIRFKIGSRSVFTGYVDELPERGTDQDLKFSGFGLWKRLEDVKVKNFMRFSIQSITKSGTTPTVTLRIYLATNSYWPLVATGLYCRILDPEDTENERGGYISYIGANYIDIETTGGVDQAVAEGSVTILPAVWSDSHTISEVFAHLCQQWGQGIGIKYDAARITPTPDAITNGIVDYDGMTVWEAIKALQKFLQDRYFIGVDGDGYYFLSPFSTSPVEYLFAGHDFHDFKLEPDLKAVINSVEITRKIDPEDKDTRGLSVIGASGENATSIKKYGRKLKNYKVPGPYSDSACEQLKDAFLRYAEPRTKGEIKDAPFRYYRFGRHRIVSGHSENEFTLDDMDSVTGWTGDLPVDYDTTELVTGTGSLRLNIDVAGELITKAVDFQLVSARSLFVYANGPVGKLVRIGIGTDAWDEITSDIETTGDWITWEVPLNIGLKRIKHIGLYSLGASSPTDVWIDQIRVIQTGARHYTLDAKEIKYSFLEQGNKASIRYGISEERLGAHLQALKARAETSELLIKRYE